MGELKCPWRMFSKFMLIPVAVFLVLLIVAALVDMGTDVYVDRGGIYVNFVIQASVWLVMAFVLFMLSVRNARKLRRLKDEGAMYEGEVVRIVPLSGHVRLLNYLTFRAECVYINNEGKSCLVRSVARAFPWLGVFMDCEGIAARVYVSRQDPDDYAIELLTSVDKGRERRYQGAVENLRCPWRMFAKFFLIPAVVFLVLITVYANFVFHASMWLVMAFAFLVLSLK